MISCVTRGTWQVCDWAAKVEATGNCQRLTKPRIAYPNLKTDTPQCPDGQLQCGDGECINKGRSAGGPDGANDAFLTLSN